MSSITKFDTAHEDLIHDISYDFYGKRLVTCSSDQRLKVWDFIEREEAAVWELNDTWKAHDSSILKAIWAHPEYGQVIASCSLDRLVKIWEEQPMEPKSSQKRWVERFRLVESRGAVLDIAFSPIQGALRLATCSADGIVRIYEALEPTNLAQWSQMEEFEITSHNDMSMSQQSHTLSGTPTPPNPHSAMPPPSSVHSTPQQQHPIHTNSSSSSSSSIASHALSTPGLDASGNAGPFPVMTSTSGGMGTTGNIHATAIPLGHHHHPSITSANAAATISPTSQNNATSTILPGGPGGSGVVGGGTATAGVVAGNPNVTTHGPGAADSGYCVDWCPNRTATPMMVVGLGKEIGARIFRHDGHSRWYPGEYLPGHEQEVHDVSWAPSMARTYQLIATASKDHFVRIYKMTEPSAYANSPSFALQQQQQQRFGQSPTTAMIGSSASSTHATMRQKSSRQQQQQMQIELVAAFNDHHAEVWRVEWNVTGTILSSSGDDGKIRLWKAGSDGVWRQMAAVSANQHHSFAS
ncbi:WD40-repeat-containing domain protein [Phascolomyces articulosus]|uniref:WD40-repeat-containing domain protein n=1 Tax=Phascolomyces articulosus TaxID=60185 RepID=A0AAD5JTF5_9FUNG|nr:WD40-repeat-containing domain protein [Phascolomyces articulosus]